MTPTATYIAEENCLRELPQRSAPVQGDDKYKMLDGTYGTFAHHQYNEDLKAYNAHLATLRKIPCRWPAKKQWFDQQVLTEGVDYELRKDDWMPETEDEYNEALHDAKNELPWKIPQVLYAFPLVPVKSEAPFVWTDELVKEYAEQYRFSSSRISIEQFKYSLTKR